MPITGQAHPARAVPKGLIPEPIIKPQGFILTTYKCSHEHNLIQFSVLSRIYFSLHLSCGPEINDVFSLLTILLKLRSQLISFKRSVFQGFLSLINLGDNKKKNKMEFWKKCIFCN